MTNQDSQRQHHPSQHENNNNHHQHQSELAMKDQQRCDACSNADTCDCLHAVAAKDMVTSIELNNSEAPLPMAGIVSYGACNPQKRATYPNNSSGLGRGNSNGKGKGAGEGTTGSRERKASCSASSASSASALSVTDDEAAYSEDDLAEQKSLLNRAAKVIPCLGILLALCASFFLGSAGMLVKMIHSVHGIQVAVFRAMIQLVVYGFMISVRRLPLMPKRGELMPVLGRAILGGTSITFSYYALRLIPLGDATTIRFSLPIWTLIVSYLVLNESCNAFKVAAMVVSISGVVLIAKPDDCVYLFHLALNSIHLESDSTFAINLADYERAKADPAAVAGLSPSLEPYQQFEGSLLALSSSIFLALSLIALRLCKRTPAEITILWLSSVSILIGTSALLLLHEWRLPNNWRDVLFILLNGICGSIGQWFITSALKIEQSGVISLARTFDIEVAFLYSAFLLHEQIRLTSIVGSALVSFGVVAVVVPKWLDSRREAREARKLDGQKQQIQCVDGGHKESGERDSKAFEKSAKNSSYGAGESRGKDDRDNSEKRAVVYVVGQQKQK